MRCKVFILIFFRYNIFEMPTRRKIVKRRRTRKVRNAKRIKQTRLNALIKRRAKIAKHKGGVPPTSFPANIKITTIDGASVELTTANTEIDESKMGTTGAMTVYNKSNGEAGSYLVKVMTFRDFNDSSEIDRIYNIEIGILKHLNTFYKDDQDKKKYFPVYFGSNVIGNNWVIATTIDTKNVYTDLANYSNDWSFVIIAKQLCEGLHLLHSAGVFHRDIKRENVVMNSKYQIMYIDFNGCYCEQVYKNLEGVFQKAGKDINILVGDGTPVYIHPDIVDSANNSQFTQFGKIPDLRKYDYWALAHLLYSLRFNTFAIEDYYGMDGSEGNQANPLDINTNVNKTYVTDMKSIQNYTKQSINPLSKYAGIRKKIVELDKELERRGCWTFTQLVTGAPLTFLKSK